MEASRIRLLNCDERILNLILAGNKYLQSGLQVTVPNNWTEFGRPAFSYSLQKIRAKPESVAWWTYLPILTDSNTLIGSCGYKGPPDESGKVEIGYEVAQNYRSQGYATEIAGKLIEQAFEHQQVQMVEAHTLAEENASVKVLRKSGFEFIEELPNEEVGKIWKWRISRQ